MEPTTGLILRRITQTELSVSAHKLATVILDAIAWKEGFNGQSRGTAAFTLAGLASKMNISRQYLTELLAELEASELELSRDEDNKTVFSGQITIGAGSNVFQTCWAELIKAAKKALPCWNVDTQLIWDRFLAFNRARGNDKVPAGFLLGFMRRWRTSPGTSSRPEAAPTSAQAPEPRERELHDQIKAAPSRNRQFHASDLCRLIGQAAYDARVLDVIRQFGCPRFTATLAVHGSAVMAGEIAR